MVLIAGLPSEDGRPRAPGDTALMLSVQRRLMHPTSVCWGLPYARANGLVHSLSRRLGEPGWALVWLHLRSSPPDSPLVRPTRFGMRLRISSENRRSLAG